MAYRIERIIPGGFHDYLINLWEGNDLPTFNGSTQRAYMFDDKATADRVAQRLAAKCSETILAEARDYIRDRWQGPDYIDGTASFHTDYCTYKCVGFTLADIGKKRWCEAWFEWDWLDLDAKNNEEENPLAIQLYAAEVSKHAWGRYAVYSHDKYQAQFPNAVPAGRYDKLDDAKKHAESVTYKMVVVDTKNESKGFIYCNWPTPLTPDNCGASQIACNIVNNTFLSLDGFEAMRKQMAGTDYTAEHFGAELARIADRELKAATNELGNAGCDKCGTFDRVEGSKLCESCTPVVFSGKNYSIELDEGLFVLINWTSANETFDSFEELVGAHPICEEARSFFFEEA